MRMGWRLATRSWQARPARTALTAAAVTLGVAVVVWLTCCYESLRRGVNRMAEDWIGRAHLTVEPEAGIWGLYDDDLAPRVAAVEGIKQTTVWTRELIEIMQPPPGAGDRPYRIGEQAVIEITGIDPQRERDFRQFDLADGRFLSPDDDGALLIESLLADALGLGVGDALHLRRYQPPGPPRTFRIVGVVHRRRASANQLLMTWTTVKGVQTLCALPGQIKGVDVLLEDPGLDEIRQAAERIQSAIDAWRKQREADGRPLQPVRIKTTEAEYQKLHAAQRLFRFILLLLCCVVMLTALFIILATMGMGVLEQIAELGLLRCTGVTRGQIMSLVLMTALPLGIAGAVLGVPAGLLLQWITINRVPEYLGEPAISMAGILLAVAGGLAATLAGAAAPALRAWSVSPADAARPYTARRTGRGLLLSTLAGIILLIVYYYLSGGAATGSDAGLERRAILAVLALFAGFAALAPLAIVVLGRLIAWPAAVLLRVHPRLIGDETHRAPFRSASICCGLMVGLSLIVGLIVWGESIKSGWQFPSEFPDALLYTYDPIPLERVQALRDTPGIENFTVTDDFHFTLNPPDGGLLGALSFSFTDQFNRFLAIDPEEGLRVVKLAFLEGELNDARKKLKRGGHILVTREFAKHHDKHLGDRIVLWVGARKPVRAVFTICGVIASPGLDIAIGFFNASPHFQTYAVGAVFGTFDDARRLFGRNYGKLMLFDFTLPEGAVASAAPGTGGPDDSVSTQFGPGGRPTFNAGGGPVPGDGPEEDIVNAMLRKLGYPPKAFVTARALKRQIAGSIDRVTLLLAAIPLLGLGMASLGLSNLMAANLAARRRWIAVLRALGLTRGQLARMVICEALVIGAVGGTMGLLLGLALAGLSNGYTERLSGFAPSLIIPWPLVLFGAVAATGLCILAALIPARAAARSDVAAAFAA